MTEYSLDPNLEEMANTIKGKSDRFIHLQVKFMKKKEPTTFEFAGDTEGLIDKLTELARRGNARVVTQAIGTYTEGTKPEHNFPRRTKNKVR